MLSLPPPNLTSSPAPQPVDLSLSITTEPSLRCTLVLALSPDTQQYPTRALPPSLSLPFPSLHVPSPHPSLQFPAFCGIFLPFPLTCWSGDEASGDEPYVVCFGFKNCYGRHWGPSLCTEVTGVDKAGYSYDRLEGQEAKGKAKELMVSPADKPRCESRPAHPET